MPAALIGVVLYLAACYAVIVYVVTPLWPFFVLGGAAVGLLLVVAVPAGTLLRVERFAAVTVTPFDVRERLPRTRTQFERDGAWPNYLFAQSRTDLAVALEHTTEIHARIWAAMTEPVRREPMTLVLWPLLILPLVAGIALTVAVVGAGLVLYGLLALVLVIAWLGWLVAVGVLRGFDRGVRALRRAKATCHHSGCNYRSTLPAFRCRCGAVHHDVRAGRQGAFVRRCECGALLPTTVLQASARLVALCQRCGRDLRPGAAVLTDVLVPVFGPPSAGKTRLVFAGMVALAEHLRAVGGSLHPVGAESETAYRTATAVVKDGMQTTKTAADQPPAGITVRLGVARRTSLLHLFDAAGEFFSDREQNRELPFLDDTQGLVFILDPFSVPAVADELRGHLASRLDVAQPARMEPEQSYLVTAQWLRDQGVALRRKPLAVAVVKADLLLGLPPAAGLDAGSGSADIERWLREKGLDNMLDGVGRDFGEVRYHLVSSLDAGTATDGWAGPTSPARPLLWLLGRSNVPVPDAVPAVAS